MYHNSLKRTLNRSKPSNLQLILVILILVVSVFQKWNIDSNGINDATMMQLCWINNIAFAIQIILLRRALGSFTNPMLLFSIFLFLFSSGQFVLYSVNFEFVNFNVFDTINHASLVNALLFIIPGYAMYQFGVLKASQKSNIYMGDIPNCNGKKQNAILIAGTIFLLIGIIPYALVLYNNFVIVSSHGYMAYYEEGIRSTSILSSFSYYFFTGLIFISVGGNKNQQRACVIILCCVALIRLISGDRGDGIVFIFTALLIHTFLREKHEKKTWKLFLVGLVCMAFVPIISTYRRYGINGVDMGRFIYDVLVENNIVTSTLSNLGGTIFPLAKTIELVPLNQDYIHGMSYLASLILLVPRIFRIGFLADIAGHKLYTSPGTWLMNSLKMTYGPGYSPFAEAYLNFGWGGIIFMSLFGYFVTRLMCGKVKQSEDILLKRGMGILTFLFFAMASRGAFNYMFPYYIRYVFIPYIFVILIINSRNKSGITHKKIVIHETNWNVVKNEQLFKE